MDFSVCLCVWHHKCEAVHADTFPPLGPLNVQKARRGGRETGRGRRVRDTDSENLSVRKDEEGEEGGQVKICMGIQEMSIRGADP